MPPMRTKATSSDGQAPRPCVVRNFDCKSFQLTHAVTGCPSSSKRLQSSCLFVRQCTLDGVSIDPSQRVDAADCVTGGILRLTVRCSVRVVMSAGWDLFRPRSVVCVHSPDVFLHGREAQHSMDRPYLSSQGPCRRGGYSIRPGATIVSITILYALLSLQLVGAEWRLTLRVCRSRTLGWLQRQRYGC